MSNFQCSGQSFCGEGTPAVVSITVEKATENIKIDDDATPLCITKTDKSIPDPEKKCYRFWGRSSIDGNVYEHFVCAVEAHYQSDASLKNEGAWLVADGVIQNDKGYFYWTGFHEGATHSRGLEVVSAVNYTAQSSTGSCNCTKPICEVNILNKNGTKITQKVKQVACNKIDIKAACDGCPPGTVKCTHNKYPGYCCIDCRGTAEKINNLANKIKG
jgi:hypothetical protein